MSDAVRSPFFRGVFFIGAVWNVSGGLVGILFPEFALGLLFQPGSAALGPVGILSFRLFMAAVVLFGVGYYLVHRDLESNRAIVQLGGGAKVAVFVAILYYYMQGPATALFLALTVGDVIFAFLFYLFLRRTGTRAEKTNCAPDAVSSQTDGASSGIQATVRANAHQATSRANAHQATSRTNAHQTAPMYEYREGMSLNATEKVILERRSIRAYKKRPLPDAAIRRILEAGRFAPSAGNVQPWKFIVVTDPEVIAAMERDTVRLTRLIMFFLDYRRSALRRIFLKPLVKLLIRLRPNELHPIPFNLMRLIAQGRTPVYHGAPAMVLLLADRRGVGSPDMDLGICGQNMILAAHSLGIGSCWIGMIKVLMKSRKWRKFFGVRYPYKLDDCIIFGYPRARYDGEVPREAQTVEWIVPGGERRFETQGV